ncbi:MAG: hypothetical protein O7J95_05125, partial [Planctomycetota bacterium]|nr:hypothetical protein [Planctomycetota bacterium]
AAAGPLAGEGHALLLLSPASMILATESSWVSSPHAAGLSGWSWIVANALVHGAILYLLRRQCLTNAARYLHRHV